MLRLSSRPLVCFGALALVPATLAQGPTPSPKTVNQRLVADSAGVRKELYRRIGLSDVQIRKLMAIQDKAMQRQRSQLQAITRKYGANPKPEVRQKMTQEMMPLFQKMKETTDREIAAVLTPEQREKFAKLQQGYQRR